jgi:hypothetical protein
MWGGPRAPLLKKKDEFDSAPDIIGFEMSMLTMHIVEIVKKSFKCLFWWGVIAVLTC